MAKHQKQQQHLFHHENLLYTNGSFRTTCNRAPKIMVVPASEKPVPVVSLTLLPQLPMLSAQVGNLKQPTLIQTKGFIMDASPDAKMQESILRKLHEQPGREAVLVPSMFVPPIMLSNIFRLGCTLKNMGYTTPPTRRMGGWHLRLLAPGIAFCEQKK